MSTTELGLDRSGNGNNFTVTNMTYDDQVVDSPTNNFATINPVVKTSNLTFSEGNLKFSTTTNDRGMVGSFDIPLDTKAYWEFTVTAFGSGTDGDDMQIGVNSSIDGLTGNMGGKETAYAYISRLGQKQVLASASSYGAAWVIGDIIGIAVDRVNDTIQFYKNNSAQGTISISATIQLFPWIGSGGGSSASTGFINFGQDSSFAGTKTAQGNQDGNSIGDFYYTPPTGFLALCTSNLPAVAVTPSEHFNTVLYSGASGDLSITGVNFQPDFTWIKQRNGDGDHVLTDAVRGVTKDLHSNTTASESTEAEGLQSFDTDGFTLGDDHGNYNRATRTYVAWNWKAGNATLGTGDFTQGSIASTCSRNVDAGFSIVSYTGTGSAGTIGHGLSKAPEIMIVKNRSKSAGEGWMVYHHKNTAAPETDYLQINTAAATADLADVWNDTAPTATLFSVAGDDSTNGSYTYIAYCFHSVDGYSKVGSYTGNNVADGTFIYLGFRPKYFMIKASSTTDGWVIYDSLRDSDGTSGYNKGTAKLRLFADNDPAETEVGTLDFLSNGVKIRAAGLAMNEAHTYIYLAFAEQPFKYSNAK
jgi:hypothetical protein